MTRDAGKGAEYRGTPGRGTYDMVFLNVRPATVRAGGSWPQRSSITWEALYFGRALITVSSSRWGHRLPHANDIGPVCPQAHGKSCTDWSWMFSLQREGMHGMITLISAAVPHRTRKSLWAHLTRVLHSGNYKVRAVRGRVGCGTAGGLCRRLMRDRRPMAFQLAP